MARNAQIKWTPTMDDEIRRVYLTGQHGGNKHLANHFKVSSHAISARAARLGLPALIAVGHRLRDESIWRQAEFDVLVAHPLESPTQLRARLYRKGFYRSEAGVKAALQRLRARGLIPTRRTVFDENDLLSVPDVAAAMGISSRQVERWVNDKLLASRSLGGQFAVRWKDLRAFLITYQAHWDHRKADKWFLVEALTYRPPGEKREAA